MRSDLEFTVLTLSSQVMCHIFYLSANSGNVTHGRVAYVESVCCDFVV